MDMDFPDFRLDGKVALVTGASKGIGVGVGRSLANAGARVAVAARDLDALEELAEQIHAVGGTARALRLDLGDQVQITAVLDQVHRELRPPLFPPQERPGA